MTRARLPLIPVLEDSVLPGEERLLDPKAFPEGAVRWLQDQAPGTAYLLLTVTAFAECPLLAGGRFATQVTHAGVDDGHPRIAGQARVRIAAARGARAPFEADFDEAAVAPADPSGRLGELVLRAVVALRHGPPRAAGVDLAPLAAASLRALGGPAAARQALTSGDLEQTLTTTTKAFLAESEGRAAVTQIEEQVRAAAAQPQLGKALRQRLYSAVVEISRRLDLHDTQQPAGETTDELDVLRRRVEQGGLPLDARAMAERELGLLRDMKKEHHDYATHLRLLQLMGRLAWHPDPLPPIDLGAVKATLDEGHAGLEKPKRRILEYLAVRALGGEGRSTVLCLAGPPGVGKTSIVTAVAKALGRPFVRVALGGVHDEAELRGHRITYTGARPGRIIDGLSRVRSRSALVLLDELDKVGTDRSRDAIGPLLEILDPEQNHAFSDNFLSVPYDLSDCLFIATANDVSKMPDFLLDRLEVIHLEGYTTAEKVRIARAHLTGGLTREHGLGPVPMSDEVVAELIEGWTREAGVRQLRREMATFYRERAVIRVGLPTGAGAPAAKEEALSRGADTPPHKKTKAPAKKGKAPAEEPAPNKAKAPETDALDPVDPADLPRLLGPRKYSAPSRSDALPPGVVTGLSVASYGGQILPLEMVRVGESPGARGQLSMTGSLGTVMKESAELVRAHVMAYRERYGIGPEVFAWDLHLHAPEAAVPKDGPSAGAALFVALVSLYRGRPVRADVALTGELGLSGQVLAVGGIRAKCLAAERAGMSLILVPRANEADVPTDLSTPVTLLEKAEDALIALSDGDSQVPQKAPVATEVAR